MKTTRVIAYRFLPTRAAAPLWMLWALWVTHRLRPLPPWVLWPLVTIFALLFISLVVVVWNQEEYAPADLKEGV